MGGMPPLRFDIHERRLVVNKTEAQLVCHIFQRDLVLRAVGKLTQELGAQGYRSKRYQSRSGRVFEGGRFGREPLYHILQNRIYRGDIEHKGQIYPGEH